MGFRTHSAAVRAYGKNMHLLLVNDNGEIPHIGRTYVCPVMDGHVDVLPYITLVAKYQYYYDPLHLQNSYLIKK